MKITKSEVKTLYSVDIQFSDFSTIFAKAKEDTSRLDNQFESFNLSDTTVGNIRKCFESMGNLNSLTHTKDVEYLVRKLGFDGVANYGYYNKRKDVYTVVAYDQGDTLNGDYNIQD